jgi:TetR/AcrR family transcriptional regulator
MQTICKAGTDLFSTKGYPETGMDDIAKASRMTKGGIYHYFHSKEEILNAICSACMDLKLGELEEIPADGTDATERIKRAIICLVSHYTNNGRAAKIVLSESRNLAQKQQKIIREKEGRCFEIVTDAIAGLLARDPGSRIVTALGFTLFSMLEGICLRFDPVRGPVPEELARLVSELSLTGARNLAPVSSSAAKTGRATNS